MNFRLTIIIAAFAAILTTNLASATIEGSTYEERHQAAIEKSIYEKCGLSGQLLQVASQQTEVRIDNGNTDINFTTAIIVRSRIDQNIFEDFNVIVQSLFSDAYDHESKNWGVYSVDTVLSTDRNCK